jgi:hypothetical protein
MERRTALQSLGDDFVDVWDQCGQLMLCLWGIFTMVKVNKLVLVSRIMVALLPVFVPVCWNNKQTNILYPGNVITSNKPWIINSEYSVAIEGCQVWLRRVLVGGVSANWAMTPIIKGCDGDYGEYLKLQQDGNLILYDTFTHRPVWASGTNGKGYTKVTIDLIKGEFIF